MRGVRGRCGEAWHSLLRRDAARTFPLTHWPRFRRGRSVNYHGIEFGGAAFRVPDRQVCASIYDDTKQVKRIQVWKIVSPFRVRANCPRLLINNEKVGMQDRLSRFLGLRQGLVFDSRSTHSGRDVAWLGDCDTGCQLLADKLGWGVKLAYFFILIARAFILYVSVN